jgi:integrase
MTMEDLCREWLVYKSPQLVNLKHRQQVQYRVDTFILPDLRKRAIGSLKRSDFVDVVKKVQAQGIVETSHRVASILSQVMDYAVDIGKIESHAANGLSRVLNAPKSKHMNCIDVSNIQKLIEDISSYDEPLVKNALLFACVTFVRTNELRYMTWNEIVDDKFWVIPKERMKLKKLHVVPLSEFSLKLLDNIRTINADYDYVLQSPTKRNSPISENTMLFALYRLGYRHLMTVHGFRALASTILNEQSPFRHDVIERQLAHKETDQVRLAYNRAEYLDERIKLMDWYSSLVSAYVK